MEYFESTPYILNQKLDFIKRENKPSLNDYYQTYDNLNITLPDMKYHFSYLKKQVKGLNDTLNASFYGNFSTNSTIMNNTQSQSFFTSPNNNFSYQIKYNEESNIPNNNLQNNTIQYLNNFNNNVNNINNENNHILNNNYSVKLQSNNYYPSSNNGIIKKNLEREVQERNLILNKYEDLFKEGYNKLTYLKNENSILKDNLQKIKKENNTNEDNENEEEENNENNNYPDLNNVKKILRSKKDSDNNIQKNDVKIDWNELRYLNDEINNLRKENLKNQQKYEIKLNELKNKIEILENKLENQNQ